MDLAGASVKTVDVDQQETTNSSKNDQEKELQDLHWIRDLILKYKEDSLDLKIELDNWLQHFANSETDFMRGSQLPSLNTLSFAVLVNYEVLTQLYHFLKKSQKVGGEALELCQKIVKGYKGFFGFDYHETILTNLGIPSSSFSINDYNKATMFPDALVSEFRDAGLNLKLTLAVLNSIAIVFMCQQNKDALALIILQAVLQKHICSLGPAHLDTIKVETQIGFCLRLLMRHSDAFASFCRIFEKLTIILGPTHEKTLGAQIQMGQILLYQGNVDEAFKVAYEVFTKRVSNFGLDHPGTVEARSLMADCHSRRKDHLKALDLLKCVRDHKSSTLGPSNFETMEAHFKVANALEGLKDYTGALLEYKSLYTLQESRERAAGEEDKLRTLCKIGSCLVILKKNEEALDVFKQILEKRMKMLGPNHIDTLNSQAGLAGMMIKQGLYADALKLLEDKYKAHTEFRVGSPIDTAQTKQLLDIGRRQLEALDIGEQLMCSICLLSMEFLEEGSNLPYDCSHLFHGICISPWLRQGKSCPECRSPMNSITSAWLKKISE